MKVTYFALKRIEVGDEWREPGDLVPEAQYWKWLPTYIKEAKLHPVLVVTLPRTTQEQLRKWEEEQEAIHDLGAEQRSA